MTRWQGVAGVAVLLTVAGSLWLRAERPGPALAATTPMPTAAAPAFDTQLFEGLQFAREDGRSFAANALQGKSVLMNCAFTRCSTTCPTSTRQLKLLQDQLAAQATLQVEFVTVSADPLQDTPADLLAYARQAGADLRHWQWLTGSPEAVAQLMERLSGSAGQKGNPLDHPTAWYLIDGFGRRIARFDGVTPDLPRLLREVTRLDQTLGVQARARLAS